MNVGSFCHDKIYSNSAKPTLTIPAAAVTMRTSALTCIRSKATPPYHNCYSRKPERERHGRRPNYYWAATEPSILSVASPSRRRSGELRNINLLVVML